MQEETDPVSTKKKESFLMYKSFYEPIKMLSTNSKGILLTAIYEYQINDKEIDMPSDVKMAFEFFKNQFRLDKKKYDLMIERNKINGGKGGRPLKPKKPTGFSNNPKNPSKPKKADNENEKDNVNDNEKDNVKEYNIKNIKKISHSKLEYKDCWEMTKRLAEDPLAEKKGKSFAQSIIDQISKIKLTERQLDCLRSLLIERG